MINVTVNVLTKEAVHWVTEQGLCYTVVNTSTVSLDPVPNSSLSL